MSKKYKGVIFNSNTVRALSGPLADAVREHRIRVAVVSNHGRTEVSEVLIREGISVDVIVGGYDLNRWGKYRKPLPDLMFVAAAKLNLEPQDMVCVSDCPRDDQAASKAGIDTVSYNPDGMDSLIPLLGENPPAEPPRDFSGIEAPVTGLMGLIVGDTVGCVYEHRRTKDFNFPLFPSGSHPTDDTVGALSIARWLIGDRTRENLIRSMVQLCNSYPRAGYSHRFKSWLRSTEHHPYGGNTNGSAMRVGACGWAAKTLEEAIDLARQTAEVSHNSDEGIRGAQAVAAGIFLARTGHTKEDIRKYVEDTFGYDFSTPVDVIRRTADHSYNCDVSIPQAFCCWLQSDTYEEAVRNAVSLATDADTIAAIAGALSAATPGMEIPAPGRRRCSGCSNPISRASWSILKRYSFNPQFALPGGHSRPWTAIPLYCNMERPEFSLILLECLA
jgi:ADP-ribosylglycohydrolase